MRKECRQQNHLHNDINRNASVMRARQRIGIRNQPDSQSGMKHRKIAIISLGHLIVFFRCIIDEITRECGDITRQPAAEDHKRHRSRTVKQPIEHVIQPACDRSFCGRFVQSFAGELKLLPDNTKQGGGCIRIQKNNQPEFQALIWHMPRFLQSIAACGHRRIEKA
ncbi:MAG: hypothetical protein IJ418_18165 [Clostridia bacterium]|nr:hypothetical protein [Clostridia bacterium]